MINKKVMALGSVGIFVILVSTIRYYFIYYDPSQAIVGVAIGVLVLFFAYVYNWMKFIDKTVDSMNIKMEGYSKFFMEKEWK